MARYNPTLIVKLVTDMLTHAQSTITIYTVLGGLAGVIVGVILGVITIPFFILIGAFIGRSIGLGNTLTLRAQAQLLLVMLQIEANTKQ